MVRVLSQHENEVRNKRVESLGCPCLDEGSIPSSSTSLRPRGIKPSRGLSLFQWYKLLSQGMQIRLPADKNFFSGTEIYFKGLEIYFSASEIYFQAFEIVLFPAMRRIRTHQVGISLSVFSIFPFVSQKHCVPLH